MFQKSSATTLDLSNFDTSKVTDMGCMFIDSKATTLDLSSFNTSNVTNMASMFEKSSATTLDLSNFDTSKVTTMEWMFRDSKATTLDLSSFDTSNVTTMWMMFANSKATTLDLSSFDTSKVPEPYMSEMFAQSAATTGYARTIEDANKFNASAYKPAGLIFEVKGYEPDIWVLATDSDFNGFTDGAFTYKGTDEYVIIPDKIKYLNVTSYANMFKGTAVKGVKSTNPNVTDMTGMFEDSTAESLDLSELNTSGVTNMANMFKNSAATTIDVSNFDTTNVTTMKGMFEGSHATTLDLSNFDTTNVTTMVNMFRGSHATTLDLSSFDLSNLGASTMKDMLSSAAATTGYARTEEDAAKLNNYNMSGRPYFLTFVVK
jgi:surface protein